MGKIKSWLLMVSLALMLGFGGIAVSGTEQASAHTYVSAVSCGSSVSPSAGMIQIAYHYGNEPWHRYSWRTMTAGEYWTYCW